jgi:hypothetical protein
VTEALLFQIEKRSVEKRAPKARCRKANEVSVERLRGVD